MGPQVPLPTLPSALSPHTHPEALLQGPRKRPSSHLLLTPPSCCPSRTAPSNRSLERNWAAHGELDFGALRRAERGGETRTETCRQDPEGPAPPQSSATHTAVTAHPIRFTLCLPRLYPPNGTCSEKKIRGRLDLFGAPGATNGSGQLVHGLCQCQKPSG